MVIVRGQHVLEYFVLSRSIGLLKLLTTRMFIQRSIGSTAIDEGPDAYSNDNNDGNFENQTPNFTDCSKD